MHAGTCFEVLSTVSLWFGVEWFWMRFARGGQFVAEQDREGTGDEKEHRAGEEEAVGYPLVIEQVGILSVEWAEEAFETAG
jgi:hypothetical protein